MVHELKLGGKVRPLLFGTTVFRRIKSETGLSISEIAEKVRDMSFLPDLTYLALRVGEQSRKLDAGDYTADDVALWLDEDAKQGGKILRWFTEATLDLSGATEEEKKTILGEAETPKQAKTTTGAS